jgi:hypothetical protein
MSKISKEQLADFINDLLDSLEEDQLDSQSGENKEQECCGVTPIELLISNFINKCIENDTLPTLQEAQTIATLDQINYRYNH